jgi:hypothetical protein
MKFRTLLLGLSALFVAFNAAFFSVTGLSKLFAGASLSVILMASSLELAKLIVAGYLYNYWDKINKLFRIYLIIGTTILVLITSLGIYGFLTSAFQDTFKTYSITSKEKTFLQQKEKFWEDDVARYEKELERISENISTLSSAKSQQIQYTDKDGTVRNTVSTAELRAAQSRIATEEKNRKEIQQKRQVATDSLQAIQIQILGIDTNTEVGSELGPLEYLSGLLGKPMDQIINWFILIIIFVFDPLAIALVVAFNNALKVDKGEDDKKKISGGRKLYGEVEDHPKDEENESFGSSSEIKPDPKDLPNLWDNTINDGLDDVEWDDDHALDHVLNDMVDDIEVKDAEELTTNEEFIKTLDKLEQRYSKELDLDGDGIVSDEERAMDLDGDGKLSEEEIRIAYENGNWKNSYHGDAFYKHPWFDWKKTERWINNRDAINYWINNKGGTRSQLEKFKTDYPTDFSTKTY